MPAQQKAMTVVRYKMRHLLLIFFLYFYSTSSGQTTYNEITDSNILRRVLHIRSMTDSFILKKVSSVVYKKLFANFGVTYQKGELYRNYLFLNKYEDDSSNIYDLTQYYNIIDKALGLSDNVGVYYSQYLGQFAPKTNNIEMRFAKNDDSLKVKALNYLYQPSIQKKLKQLTITNKFTSPFVQITIDGKSGTWFVFLKDKVKPHNLPL